MQSSFYVSKKNFIHPAGANGTYVFVSMKMWWYVRCRGRRGGACCGPPADPHPPPSCLGWNLRANGYLMRPIFILSWSPPPFFFFPSSSFLWHLWKKEMWNEGRIEKKVIYGNGAWENPTFSPFIEFWVFILPLTSSGWGCRRRTSHCIFHVSYTRRYRLYGFHWYTTRIVSVPTLSSQTFFFFF